MMDIEGSSSYWEELRGVFNQKMDRQAMYETFCKVVRHPFLLLHVIFPMVLSGLLFDFLIIPTALRGSSVTSS